MLAVLGFPLAWLLSRIPGSRRSPAFHSGLLHVLLLPGIQQAALGLLAPLASAAVPEALADATP